jgi:hypothetical protein
MRARLSGARSLAALSYDDSRAIGTWTPSELPSAGVASANAALQEAR